jgi:hypothetical protein
MSNITRFIATDQGVSNSRASQTPEKSDKGTHADYRPTGITRIRLRGEHVSRYSFCEVHPDRDMAELLDDISVLMDTAWDCCQRDPISAESCTFQRQKTTIGCGTKRSISDRELEKIYESHEYQQDMGTDPMPLVEIDTSDKETQVSSSELEQLKPASKQLRLGKVFPLLSIRNPFFPLSIRDRRYNIQTTGIQTPFEVFEEQGYTNSNLARRVAEQQDAWIDAGLETVFHRRRILAEAEGVHPDTTQRLERLRISTTNPFNNINSDFTVVTLNEFPVEVVRAMILRTGDVVNMNGRIVSRFVVDGHARRFGRQLGVDRLRGDPFIQVPQSRRSRLIPEVDLVEPNQTNLPFWQRLGIRTPVPRVWVYGQRSMTNHPPRDPFVRIQYGERS